MNLIISPRIYTGKLSDGMVIEKIYSFSLDGKKGILKKKEEIYNRGEKEKSKEISLSEDEIEELKSLVVKLKDERALSTDLNIAQKYSKVDVYIDDEHIEVHKDSEVLKKIIKLIRINVMWF